MKGAEGCCIGFRYFPSALAVLVLLILAGCAAQRAGYATSSEKSANFVSEGWILGTTRAEVRARLGPPLTIQMAPMKNQHDPDRSDALWLETFLPRPLIFPAAFLVLAMFNSASLLGVIRLMCTSTVRN